MLYKRSEDGKKLLADIADEAAHEMIITFLRMTEEDFEYVSSSTIRKIIPEVCNVLIEELADYV
uniref:Uncharacterized protein n=1 Tax=Anopheles stephensi TaxID=30069 RepID=A0A182YRB5_ANOST